MRKEKKIKVALEACQQHIDNYKEFNPAIPERFLQFWKSGEAFNYNKLCLPLHTPIPGWDSDTESFRLYVVAPSWETECLGVDDAVVGPTGDWEHAYNYLPFMVGGYQGEFSLVVKLDDPQCPVGIFAEACWDRNKKGYTNGVYLLSSSLDAFLASLVKCKEATVDMELEAEDAFTLF